MSNCVVGSVGLRLPRSIIAEHSVEGSDHFSHDGDDDDLGFLVGVGKTIGEGLESGIVSACAEGCHVEDITDRHPTAVDTAVSPELATVEVVWCETDEGGDLLAAHRPEFWQQGDEREGQHRADARHRGEQLIELSESSIGGNHLGQALVEEADIGLQSDQAAFAEPPEHGIFEMSCLVLDGDMLVTQLSPHGDDLGEPFDRVVPLHNPCRHDGNILRDQSRIEAIVLGQDAAGAGELTKLVGVDTSHRQSGREQGTDDTTLVTAARLKANCGDRERAQPFDQLGPAGGIVTHRKEPALRQHHHVQAVLRHVNAAIGKLFHLRIPSLLMRARAQATVRVWKKRLEHQAHSRSDIRGGCGLPVATRVEIMIRPSSPLTMLLLRHTRRREFIAALGGAAAAWPLAARAQQRDRMRRIGVLMPAAADDRDAQDRVAAFLQGLQQSGWSVGRNVRIEYRWSTSDADAMRTNAVELVALAPDVILANGNAAMTPLLRVTRAVPIVFAAVADPVGAGYVSSLARPGGNATGFVLYEFGLSGKWLELLKEFAPGVTRVAVIRDASVSAGIGQFAAIQSVAPSFGVELTPVDVQ